MEEIRRRFKSFLVLSTVVVLVFIVLVVYLKTELLKTETYRHQLVAVCGVVDEIVEQESIIVMPPHEEGTLRGAISFITAEEQEDFVVLRRYNIFPDGTITIYERGADSKEQVIEKSWKDYPLFFSIGKK